MFWRKKRKKLLETTSLPIPMGDDIDAHMNHCQASAKHCMNQAKRLLRRGYLGWWRLIDSEWKPTMLKLSNDYRKIAVGYRDNVQKWRVIADRKARLDGMELEAALREDTRE